MEPAANDPPAPDVTIRMYRYILVTFVLLQAGLLFAAEPAGWIGDKVFARKPGSTIVWIPGAVPGSRVATTLLYLDYTVVDEEKTHIGIRLFVNGRTTIGRIAKGDVVRLADAPDFYTKVLAASPTNDAAHLQRGWAHHLLGHMDEARDDYDKAVVTRAKTWFAWNNRALIRIDAGDYKGAVEDVEKAAKLNPQSPVPKYVRGLVHVREREVSEAIMEFEAALKIDPNYTVAILDRGAAHELQGSFDLARIDYETACRLDPGDAIAWSRRAWLLSAHPNPDHRHGRNAVGYAKIACELSRWKDAVCLAGLAAAYAEMGNFDAAVKWQQKALEDAKYRRIHGTYGNAVLESYRQKMPVRIVVQEP